MRFVYVMDPMERLSADKDTTIAFQRAAQKRGHASLHCEMRDLWVVDGEVHGRVRDVVIETTFAAPTPKPGSGPWFKLGEPYDVRLADVDAVFIRKDPPFDSQYLYATLLLERLRGRTTVVNDPRGLRDANEKLYALHFARHMPKTMVASDRDRLLAFVDSIGGTGVIKPLDGAGGSGVMLLAREDKNARAIIETLTHDGRIAAMVQEYLPAVRKGDKRVILLDGEVLGAINRVPRADDLRSNIHVGGKVEQIQVTPEERAIITDIAPRLRADGLFFVGLDFIGGKMTEVNVTSPTGIQELGRHMDRDVAEDVIVWTEKRAADLAPHLRSIPVS
jgi:glutathione synthase